MKHIKLYENLNNNLTEVIKKIRDQYIERGLCNNYSQINAGLCVDFSDDVEDMFDGRFETLTTSMFYVQDDNGKRDYMINTLNDTMIPCGDLEWSKNQLDLYGYPDKDLMIMEPPRHIWIYYNGKHYDAECPDGVDNPWELPVLDEDYWF